MPRCGRLEIVGYVPPELKTPKSGWYIDYYVLHPETKKTVRKRIKINKPADLKARKLYAREVLTSLTQKLSQGWNPFIKDAAPQSFVVLGDALDQWDRTKRKQLRHGSPLCYNSFSNVLREWCREKGLLKIYAHAFNRMHAVDFLAYVSDYREVGNTTYNNYLQHFNMIFEWFIERLFISENPFAKFQRRKEAHKTRTYLTEEDRELMSSWIQKHDPRFWMPCLFVYGTLIRPGELRRLRVHHVDLERQVVTLPAEQTKNGYERMPAIPDWMVEELRAMELHKQPGRAFLIGRGMVPGEKQIARNALRNQWLKMRDALHWDKSKQFYSLRDTGIIQLIRDGVDLLHVRQQAGHADIATTNAYLKHAFPKGPAEVRAKGTALQATTPLVMGQPLYQGDDDGHKVVPRFEELERNYK